MSYFRTLASAVRRDDFFALTKSAQSLYFQLVVDADVNGIIVNPKTLIREVDSNDKDLNQLLKSGFAYELGNWVVIRDWNEISKAKQC